MCVTSPPYWGLRDYGHPDQLGQEPTVQEYVSNLVAVFREVWRVLRYDGTLWLNLGDTYGKGKQLTGVPWLVAFALQRDGWVLRRDIIWHKTRMMPENVKDRPAGSHEYVFMLSKATRYHYDGDAIREPYKSEPDHYSRSAKQYRESGKHLATQHDGDHTRFSGGQHPLGRNKRSVWSIATSPYKGAHFATFPPKLIEPCILAGSREGDTVLDPFGGSGTTGLVANRLGRDSILIELNPEYAEMARRRITNDAPMFASVEIA